MLRRRSWLTPVKWQAVTLLFLAALVVGAELHWAAALSLAAVVVLSTGWALRVHAATPDLGLILERLSREPDLAPQGDGTTAVWPAVARLLSRQQNRADHLATRVMELETVLDALPDPLILLDGTRAILRTNAAATRLFAVQPDSLSGQDLAQLLRNPDLLAATDGVLGGGAARTVELSLRQPADREMTVRVEPLGSGADGPGPVGPGQTRRHQTGADRPRALLILYDQTRAKRTEQMRSDFVANASHELKTPLSTLIGFIETLRGPAQGDLEAQERFLSIMHEQAARMARLVEDLLSLSRIELDEHVAPTAPVRIEDLVRQVADVFEIKAARRSMTVELAIAPDLPAVAGNTDELAQLLQNLVDNALKYGHPGTPVTLSAVPSERIAGGVLLGVRDQGDGIAREHLPRLTERFYRVDTARSRAMGGTGLGLAIVKHIVNRHRGILQIDSEPGRGSCFMVHLRPAPAERAHPMRGR